MNDMQRGNRFRIYPTIEQEKRLKRDFKHSNYVYNWYLGLMFLGQLLANVKNRTFSNREELDDFVKREIFFILNKKNRSHCLPKNINTKERYKHLIMEQVLKLEVHSETFRFLIELWNSSYEETTKLADTWCEQLGLDLKLHENKWFSWNKSSLSSKLTILKKGAMSFLNSSPASILKESLANADKGFQNWYKKRAKRPKFKNRFSKLSFSSQNNDSRNNTGVRTKFASESEAMTKAQNRLVGSGRMQKLVILKYNEGLKINVHRPVNTALGTVCISLDRSGRFYASFPSDTQPIPPKRNVDANSAIGFDCGLTSFVVKDDGTKISLPKFHSDLEEKIKFYERRLQKIRDRNPNWKLSKRYEKQRQRKACLESKIAERKNDFQHKVSHELLNPNISVAGGEGLNVKNMVKNKKLSKHISRASWGEFLRKMKYKSELRGINYVEADVFFASSKICSVCNAKIANLPLDIREWTCNNCGTEHDRDQNAAINLKQEALRILNSSS